MLKIFSNPICTKVGVHFTPIITRKQEKERRAHRVIRTYTARSVPGEMERETERAREGWGGVECFDLIYYISSTHSPLQALTVLLVLLFSDGSAYMQSIMVMSVYLCTVIEKRESYISRN